MTFEKKPVVSVVMPVFNGAAFVREALESVLCQTLPAFEILVMDDGSTDETPGLLSTFKDRIRTVSLSHGGADAARNQGVIEAKGEFVCFFDADDIMIPQRLSLQCRVLTATPDLDFVFGNLVEFEGEVPKPTDPAWTAKRKAGLCGGTLMARRTALLKVGLFETRWKIAGFMEWYFRVQDGGFKSRMLDEVVLLRRIHGTNLSLRESSSMALEYAQVIKLRNDKKKAVFRDKPSF